MPIGNRPCAWWCRGLVWCMALGICGCSPTGTAPAGSSSAVPATGASAETGLAPNSTAHSADAAAEGSIPNGAPAPNPASAAESSSSASNAADGSAANGSAAGGAAAAARADTPAAPLPPAPLNRPVWTKEAVALLDMREFPKMETAYRQSATPTTSGCSALKTADMDLKGIMAQCAAFLAERGWQPLPGSGMSEPNEYGADAMYTKDGLVLQFGIGISRGSNAGEQDFNMFASHIGAVDARTLPRVGNADPRMAQFDRVIYSTDMPIKECHEFYKNELTKSGWVPYKSWPIPGLQLTEEQALAQQRFIQKGQLLGLHYSTQDGRTEINCGLTLIPVDLPIPPTARMLELEDSKGIAFFVITGNAEDVRAFYVPQMQELGWTNRDVPVTEEGVSFSILFEQEGREPLRLDGIVEETIVNVLIKPVPKE